MSEHVKFLMRALRINDEGRRVATLYNVPVTDTPDAEFIITPPPKLAPDPQAASTRFAIFKGGTKSAQGYRLLVLGSKYGEPTFSFNYAADHHELAEQLSEYGLQNEHLLAVGDKLQVPMGLLPQAQVLEVTDTLNKMMGREGAASEADTLRTTLHLMMRSDPTQALPPLPVNRVAALFRKGPA